MSTVLGLVARSKALQGLRLLSTGTNLLSREVFSEQLPSAVKIVEVGPRDGLQNEHDIVPTEVKVELVNRLSAAGLPVVEATSFVSPKWVPQLADAAAVLQGIQQREGVAYPVLTPNLKGLELALKAGAREVAIFPAASEAFSKRNLNCSIDESLKRFADVAAAAREAGVPVRGYVSVAVGCPYQGKVEPEAAADIAARLLGMGCYEVSMGDTIGIGTPAAISRLFKACKEVVPVNQLAAHLHDTYGQAIANIYAALQLGITTYDSSIAGLGGCPYAKGATGNVATEDVVYLLNGFGIQHGIDMDKLLDTSQFIANALGRKPNSKVAQAMLAARQREMAA